MIKKIINGNYLKRLDNIKQWQEQDVFNQESVSQHSYKVAIFARVLLEDIFESNSTLDVIKYKLDVTTQALLHDWDEALIRRDISHDTKYNKFNGEDIREALDNLSEHLAKEEFKENKKDINEASSGYFSEPTSSSDLLVSSIVSPEEGVKTFVKLCDWLALRFYVIREIQLGNRGFENTLNYCNENIIKSSNAVTSSITKNFPDKKINLFTLSNILL